MIAFVESKAPDMARVAALLERCRDENRWANGGPVFEALAAAFAAHLGLGPDRAAIPVANGGVGLEAIARLLALRAGRRLRWVGPAFAFHNLGRGWFADMTFLDCDARGVLDAEAVRALDPESWDGIVAVNPFGLARDFSALAAVARAAGRPLILDNAAGIDATIPDIPWQSFSLHHTKPYGAGEGGLVAVPAEAAAELRALLEYGDPPADPALWLNNGKISDIACAFHLDRLERVGDWAPRYREQAARVARIAGELGLVPLLPVAEAPPATSLAFLADAPVPIERTRATARLVFAKYYKPLAPLPRTQALYDRLLNVPAHPDVAALDDAALADEIAAAAFGGRMPRAAARA